MILADKIINLRKKNGMSQEELAAKLNVSRQSVSKWEGAQSIPDLDKIIALSQIFGVSTDFLLKDEVELEDKSEMIDSEVSDKKKVTMQMANDYVSKRFYSAKLVATGVLLCILSPLLLIVFGWLSDYYSQINENFACGAGIVVLIIMVVIAICLFLYAGNITKEYEFITTQVFETEYGVTGLVKQKKKEYDNTYFKGNIIGIVLCVLSVIPLLITSFTENEVLIIFGLVALFILASIGVYILVYVGCKNGTLVSLLQEGEYSKEKKQKDTIIEAISGSYWLIVTAIYLLWSFLTNAWDTTWLVWPVAGVLYGAIFGIIHAINIQKKNK